MGMFDELFDRVKEILGVDGKTTLSDFQTKKLLHEFHMFYDVNKDGRLQWKDFELSRGGICKLNGWKLGTDKYKFAQELFRDIWSNLQDQADDDFDGEITRDEWLEMWTKILQGTKDADRQQQKTSGKDPKDPLPTWFHRYIEYKFHLYDRAADGVVDAEEFEYCLHDGFGVPVQDCRKAFTLFTNGGQECVTFEYFRELALQYYLSNDPDALGNFINGKLSYDDS